MISAFHGIGAYRGQRNPLALRQQLDTCLTGVEICVADRAIGAFGAVLFGECTAVFDRDVWSQIGPGGTRVADGWEPALIPASQQEFEDFAAREGTYHPRAYCEAWMRPLSLRALWIKTWAPEATQRAAKILARHRRVPLIRITDAHNQRIWTVLDNLPSAVYTTAA